MKIKMIVMCLVLLAMALPAIDMLKPMALPNSDETILTESIYHNGLNRTYIVVLPQGFNAGTTYDMIFVLHGHGGDAEGMRSYINFFVTMEERNSFILVYVNGFDKGWNVIHCCGNAHMQNVDDVGLFRLLIGTMRQTYNIRNIFSTGHSNGGMMSHRLAAECSDMISAIADVSGCVGGQNDNGVDICWPSIPQNNVSVMMIHGMKDNTIFYNEPYKHGFYSIPFLDGVNWWASANNLTSKSENTTSDYRVISWDDGKTEVVGYSYINVGHEWADPFKTVPMIFKWLSEHGKDKTEPITE